LKKVKKVNGLIIAEYSTNESKENGYSHAVFTEDEFAYGSGLRSEEWQASNLQEAIEWAKSY
jgi:hypothetical protein